MNIEISNEYKASLMPFPKEILEPLNLPADIFMPTAMTPAGQVRRMRRRLTTSAAVCSNSWGGRSTQAPTGAVIR